MSAPDPPPPWIQALTAGVMGLTALGVVAGLTVIVLARGRVVSPMETDRGRLERIVRYVGVDFALHQTPPAADGRLEVYGVLRRRHLSTEEIRELCTSARSGEGPSEAEIAADDYRDFPWQRFRGEPPELDTLVFWDRAPTNGERLVARRDMSVFTVSEATMQDFFAAHPGQE